MKGKIKAIVFNHGHHDIEWYKTLDSYRFWFLEVVDILYDECRKKKNYKTYIFDGSVFILNDLIKRFPDYKKKIITLIKGGKLVIGPFYTQFDEWIPSAETMVRNCLWGDRKTKELKGKPMKCGYFPDNFGHSFQVPQLLDNFGIKNLLFMRGMEDIDSREFILEGADGTRIIAVNNNYSAGYMWKNNNPKDKNPNYMPYYRIINGDYEYAKCITEHKDREYLSSNLIESVKNVSQFFESGIQPVPMGSDHFPPQVGLGDTLEYCNKIQDDIDFIFSTPEEYFKLLSEKGVKAHYKGELKGSATDYILFGVLSGRIYQKIDIFSAETLLFKYTLPMLTLAENFGFNRSKYDTLVNEVIETALVNSTHDSVHGSSVDGVHTEMQARNVFIKQTCSDLIIKVSQFFNSLTGANKEGERTLIVYNANNEKKKQVVSLLLPSENKKVEILDGDKVIAVGEGFDRSSEDVKNVHGLSYYTVSPSLIYNEVKFTVELPPYSVKKLSWRKAGDIECAEDQASSIENEYFKVDFNGKSFDITDKRTNIRYENLNVISEIPDVGDAWDQAEPYKPFTPVYSKDGVIKSVKHQKDGITDRLTVHGAYDLPREMHGDDWDGDLIENEYVYEVSLYEGVDRIEFKLDYTNRAKDHTAFLNIPLAIDTDNVLSQNPFYTVNRPIEKYKPKKEWADIPTEHLPFNEWIALSDKKNGFAMAFKGLCDYKVDKENGKVMLKLPINRSYGTINRINNSRRQYAPGESWKVDEAQCLRTTSIEFAFIPYEIKGDKMPFINDVETFLYPPVCICPFSDGVAKDKNTEFSCFKILSGDVRVSLFDSDYSGKNYILRVYEDKGKKGTVEIDVGKNEVYFVNLNEEKINKAQTVDGKVKFEISPYKIITLMWKK